MHRPTRPCPTPGCPNLTRDARGCQICQARRDTPYDSCWREIAAAYLRNHPTCQMCGQRRAQQVHHRLAVSIHPRRRLDPMNLEALCWGCHRSVTPTVAADAAIHRRR